jgi:tol-pal system protein YbgF
MSEAGVSPSVSSVAGLGPRWRRSVGAALFALSLGGAGPAHALFDDTEARRAIVELRARVTAQEEADKARFAELAATQARYAEDLQALRRSLLELNNQIEALRAELAKMRGNDEQLTREVTELQRRQRDIAQGVDERLRKVEPQKVAVDGQEFLVDQEERRVYEEALGFMRTGDFERSLNGFQTLLKRWPATGYLPSALFWSGNANYGRKDYAGAVNSFRSFLAQAPGHPRAPEGMLGLANSQVEMKDTRAARKTLEDLLKQYPNTDAAAAAKQRLATLR